MVRVRPGTQHLHCCRCVPCFLRFGLITILKKDTSPEGNMSPPGWSLKGRERHATSHLLQVCGLSPQGTAPMPPITGGLSLFATSSTRWLMALPCGWVASDLHRWRVIGFTSFPKVPRWLAGQQMGLGTHFPPGITRERSNVHDHCSQDTAPVGCGSYQGRDKR